VTGAGGYLGSHCVQQLLNAGYSVRGTVRDPKNETKVRPLKQLDGSERLELVKADLEHPDDWPRLIFA
jgi:nucleoside-diphosphate-sugar epimerase